MKTIDDRIYEILLEIEEAYGLSNIEILGDRRYALFAQARQELYARMRRDLGMSWLHIADKLHKNHATILYGARKALARGLLTDREKASDNIISLSP